MTKQILLCDDEIHILRAAEFKLRRAGYDVRTAGDGEEAWQAILAQKPDVLITDCQMPRLGGLGLAERVRENPATRDLPVLLLTAKGFELSFEELAAKWNIRTLIAKPFSPRELLQIVNGVLCEEPAEDRHKGAEAQGHEGTEAQRHRGTKAQGEMETAAPVCGPVPCSLSPVDPYSVSPADPCSLSPDP